MIFSFLRRVNVMCHLCSLDFVFLFHFTLLLCSFFLSFSFFSTSEIYWVLQEYIFSLSHKGESPQPLIFSPPTVHHHTIIVVGFKPQNTRNYHHSPKSHPKLHRNSTEPKMPSPHSQH